MITVCQPQRGTGRNAVVTDETGTSIPYITGISIHMTPDGVSLLSVTTQPPHEPPTITTYLLERITVQGTPCLPSRVP